ncbi:flagellar hook protein FlgE [Desulfopila sp. IMCC35008]|uniref:flagellar hook protein FlgE n=1 Tax=Desulfopila sp. IMCC35008 TaxID=2653858 RepID=UPI0013D208ED|nr:flagellar hook protein FlgE [Desulfopila sp. IMCC35008]
MGISSALYSGVSGISTNSQALTVIGNNLANTNTLGFKGARTVFSDLLSSTINGSGGKSQVGRGVGVSKVDNLFTQGTFESTESPLDVAIEGPGFFLLSEPGDDSVYYSKGGAFRFDENGYLMNPEGYRVQGKLYDENGVLEPGDPTDIMVSSRGLIGGNATTEATLTTNLDSTEPIMPIAGFVFDDPTTYNYSSSTQVFDSLGNEHLITSYFNKIANNEWRWSYSYTDDTGAVTTGLGAILGDGGPGLTFNTDGIMVDPDGATPDVIEPTTGTIPGIDWLNGSEPGQAITITFDTTQFNSESAVISQEQNGYGAGEMTGVNIDDEGTVIASFSNGEQIKVAHLVLSTFTNPRGLESIGKNLYKETDNSGGPRTGLPGVELGKIFTNSLEQSNVDMGAEFVRMITVQRGFQANSKIITTVDELLGDLINLKR